MKILILLATLIVGCLAAPTGQQQQQYPQFFFMPYNPQGGQQQLPFQIAQIALPTTTPSYQQPQQGGAGPMAYRSMFFPMPMNMLSQQQQPQQPPSLQLYQVPQSPITTPRPATTTTMVDTDLIDAGVENKPGASTTKQPQIIQRFYFLPYQPNGDVQQQQGPQQFGSAFQVPSYTAPQMTPQSQPPLAVQAQPQPVQQPSLPKEQTFYIQLQQQQQKPQQPLQPTPPVYQPSPSLYLANSPYQQQQPTQMQYSYSSAQLSPAAYMSNAAPARTYVPQPPAPRPQPQKYYYYTAGRPDYVSAGEWSRWLPPMD